MLYSILQSDYVENTWCYIADVICTCAKNRGDIIEG